MNEKRIKKDHTPPGSFWIVLAFQRLFDMGHIWDHWYPRLVTPDLLPNLFFARRFNSMYNWSTKLGGVPGWHDKDIRSDQFSDFSELSALVNRFPSQRTLNDLLVLLSFGQSADSQPWWHRPWKYATHWGIEPTAN